MSVSVTCERVLWTDPLWVGEKTLGGNAKLPEG